MADRAEYYKRYLTYLKSTHWDNLRHQAFARDNYKCSKCGSSKNLVGHHLRYASDLYKSPVEDIQTLCESCHNEHHRKDKKSPEQRQADRKERKAFEARKRAFLHEQKRQKKKHGNWPPRWMPQSRSQNPLDQIRIEQASRQEWERLFYETHQITHENKTTSPKSNIAIVRCPRCDNCFTIPDREPECPF